MFSLAEVSKNSNPAQWAAQHYNNSTVFLRGIVPLMPGLILQLHSGQHNTTTTALFFSTTLQQQHCFFKGHCTTDAWVNTTTAQWAAQHYNNSTVFFKGHCTTDAWVNTTTAQWAAQHYNNSTLFFMGQLSAMPGLSLQLHNTRTGLFLPWGNLWRMPGLTLHEGPVSPMVHGWLWWLFLTAYTHYSCDSTSFEDGSSVTCFKWFFPEANCYAASVLSSQSA